jgi:hypothetical protein
VTTNRRIKIELHGQRTHCVTQKVSDVPVTLLVADGIVDVVEGGVTGYESWSLRGILDHKRAYLRDGLTVHAGKLGRWDRLWIPPAEMLDFFRAVLADQPPLVEVGEAEQRQLTPLTITLVPVGGTKGPNGEEVWEVYRVFRDGKVVPNKDVAVTVNGLSFYNLDAARILTRASGPGAGEVVDVGRGRP